MAVLAARVPRAAREWTAVAFDVPPEVDGVGTARRLTAQTLGDWAIPAATIDDVVLLASELVTNAIVHGRPPIELRLRRTAAEVLLEVLDGANLLPRRLRPTPEDEHGRGLQIVAVLADRWGARVTESGKAMWAITKIKGDGNSELAAGSHRRRPVG